MVRIMGVLQNSISLFFSLLLRWVSTLTLRSGKKLSNASSTRQIQGSMEEGKHFLCPEGRFVYSGCFSRECESAWGLTDCWSSGSWDHRTGQWVWLIPLFCFLKCPLTLHILGHPVSFFVFLDMHSWIYCHSTLALSGSVPNRNLLSTAYLFNTL